MYYFYIYKSSVMLYIYVPALRRLFYCIGKFDFCGARIAMRFLERRVSQSTLFFERK